MLCKVAEKYIEKLRKIHYQCGNNYGLGKWNSFQFMTLHCHFVETIINYYNEDINIEAELLDLKKAFG